MGGHVNVLLCRGSRGCGVGGWQVVDLVDSEERRADDKREGKERGGASAPMRDRAARRRYAPQLTVSLSKLTVTTPPAFVLRWVSSWAVRREPSVPVRWKVLVSCWTSFLLLNASPNQAAKWPLAETPSGLSGVKV